MVSKQSRSEIRRKQHYRLRNRFAGTAERPRLAVFRSNNHMYAQIIDGSVGHTLVSASTLEKEIKAELGNTDTVDAAAYIGTVVAKRAIEKGIKEVVFDSPGGWSRILLERRKQHEAYNHRRKSVRVKRQSCCH